MRIVDVDPQSEVALSLLREAAIDARALYADVSTSHTPWPTNGTLFARGVYVVAYIEHLPLGCGALTPIDDITAEVRRMYVHRDHRRRGLGGAILRHLIAAAKRLDFNALRLETGFKQYAAAALYESLGFQQISAFGEYMNDPTSVCYELRLSGSA